MTDERLEHIEQLRAGAVYAPWGTVEQHEDGLITVSDGEFTVCVMSNYQDIGIDMMPTAEFIAFSPQIVDELIAEVQRLRTENACYRTTLEAYADEGNWWVLDEDRTWEDWWMPTREHGWSRARAALDGKPE